LTSQLQVELLGQEIRKRLVGKESRLDIMRALRLSKSAYYYHLDAIKEEDQEWLTELAKGDLVSEMRTSLDTLAAIEKMLFAIAPAARRTETRSRP